MPFPCAQNCPDVTHTETQKVRRSGAHSPPLSTHTAESLSCPWEPWPGPAGAGPDKATAQPQLVAQVLQSQRELRSPTTQDHGLKPWAAPHTPCVPALPQQELGAVGNCVSREPEAGPGHQEASQLPAPMPWLKCISHD